MNKEILQAVIDQIDAELESAYQEVQSYESLFEKIISDLVDSYRESNKDYNDGINRAIEIIEQRFHLHTEPYIADISLTKILNK